MLAIAPGKLHPQHIKQIEIYYPSARTTERTCPAWGGGLGGGAVVRALWCYKNVKLEVTVSCVHRVTAAAVPAAIACCCSHGGLHLPRRLAGGRALLPRLRPCPKSV